MSADFSTLESMCELIVDCPHSTPKWTDSGVIVLRNQNIKNGVLDLSSPSYTNEKDYEKRVKRAVPKVGDIVFTREAPMGDVCKIPSDLRCCLGQRQVLLRPKLDISGDYLFWSLQSPQVQEQISWNEGTGSTVSNVRIPVLKALNIPRLDSLTSEVKTAKILSDLAQKIQLNRQINQTLESMAQAIFQSWFVDFDPVKAKIAAREQWQILTDDERTEWLNELLDTQDYFKTCLLELTAKAGLNDDENVQLDSSLDLISCRGHGPESSENLDIGFNNLRKEWQSKKVGPALQSASETLYLNIAAMTAISSRNETSLADMPADEFSQLYKTASLFPERLVDSELGEMPEGWSVQKLEDIIELAYGKALKKTDRIEGGVPVYGSGGVTGNNNESLVEGPGIIVGRKGTVGSLYWEDQSFFPIDTVFYVKTKPDITLLYVYYLLQMLGLENMNTDAAVPGLNRNNVYRLAIVKPPESLIFNFSEMVSSFRKEIFINQKAIQSLEAVRDSILPKLVSGELDMTFKFDS
ncbi:restriction endonuclease subunit S [Thalassolituus oleivorans]|uniref:restriction endonuclease subunit S n=1 Tax=Thalassolituus oleivorans TaxID=187493 RepID=UPI00240A2E79|nr:restriction endonuclease subunit S [Thalassolituus oleivorans]MDF1641291.1 restriction endonuclease subunit S [Thalassolituus oleivorans]